MVHRFAGRSPLPGVARGAHHRCFGRAGGVMGPASRLVGRGGARVAALCAVLGAAAGCSAKGSTWDFPGGDVGGAGGSSVDWDTSPVILAASPPPPLSGGTLLLAND